MSRSKIEWTDITENPITVKGGGHWCRKISEGCAHCYAENINNSNRFGFASHLVYSGEAPELEFNYEMVGAWHLARKPKRRFVGSMTDVFGEWVPKDWQFRIFDEAGYAPSQTIQLLTKRPQAALASALEWCKATQLKSLPDNLWIGVSVEDAAALHRVPVLLKLPAKVRFLSVEPMLEAVEVYQYLDFGFTAPRPIGCRPSTIDWVICGGESGTNARPFHLEWAVDLARQCRDDRIPFFFKQTGSNAYWRGEKLINRSSRSKGGDPDYWPEELENVLIREFPV